MTMKKPATANMNAESRNWRDCEKRQRLVPKPTEPTTMRLLKMALLLLSIANNTAPKNAPKPADAMSMPMPFGPARSILSANTGMSTTYDMPVKLTKQSNINASLIGLALIIYAIPSVRYLSKGASDLIKVL